MVRYPRYFFICRAQGISHDSDILIIMMKKVFSTLVMPILLCGSAMAEEYTEGNLRFTTTADGEATVSGYVNQPTGDLIIPTETERGDVVTSIGYRAFFNCSDISSVTFPEHLKSFDFEAFFGCRGLSSLTFPESVSSIGEGAFHLCSGLQSVTFPETLSDIGGYAFYGCTGLKSVTLPKSLTEIEDYAFMYSTAIETVTCQATTPPTAMFDYNPFAAETYNQATLYVPKESLNLYKEVNSNCWSHFLNIEGLDLSGIQDVESADGEETVTVYNLNGIQVFEGRRDEMRSASLPHGLYIVKTAAGATKQNL